MTDPSIRRLPGTRRWIWVCPCGAVGGQYPEKPLSHVVALQMFLAHRESCPEGGFDLSTQGVP